MKNTFKVLGIIALLAIIGVSMAACGGGDDDGGGSKFEGRWLNLYAVNDNGYTDFSFTFTGNSFSFKSAGKENFTRNGTFTFTDTAITLTPISSENWPTITHGYTLTGGVLNLSIAQGGFCAGTFTKQ